MSKISPHNLDAEQSFLGSILVDKDAIYKVGDIVLYPDFYSRKHQLIYEAILYLFEKNEQIDLLTVANKLQEKKVLDDCGGNTYLAELTEMVPTSAHILDYAKIIKDKKVLRDLILISSNIAELGYQEEEETDILLDRAEKQVFDIAQKNLIQKFILIKDILGESFERINHLHSNQGKTRGIPTGYIDLDNKLSGLQKSDLIILASRPALGKSSLSSDIARNVAISGVPVGIFSLEMSKDQIVDRLISAETGINLWKIRNGKLSEANNDFEKIKEALDKIAKMPIYINDLSSCNVLQVKAMARRLQAQKGLGLVIIDYLQLMEPRGINLSPVQQMSEISRSLKVLARELNVPVLALSQLNRSVEQRTPQIPRLSDLRESGSLEQDSDVVMFIHRRDKYDENAQKGMAEIIIAKHRNGPTGKVNLFFDETLSSFKSIDKIHTDIDTNYEDFDGFEDSEERNREI